MKNIREIANLAGVSRATVSRVLNDSPAVNEETRAHVRKIIQEHNYRPNLHARQITSEGNPVVGVVVATTQDPFFSELVSGVEQVCLARENVALLVSEGGDSAETERAAISNFLARGCDGLIVHTKYLPDEELQRFVKRLPNIVFINREVPELLNHCLWLDNFQGGVLAAEALIAAGRRRISVIGALETIVDSEDRLAGVRSVMRREGLTLEERNVFRELSSVEGGRIAMRRLLSAAVDCDGVVAFNDAMAIGALQTIADNGLAAPQDISVVGFDNLKISAFTVPSLSTIDYPVETMAKRATNAVLDMILKKRGTDVVELVADELGSVEPTLIKRESIVS